MKKILGKLVSYQIRAFTILESLLALSIVSLILLLSSKSLTQVLSKVEGELFVLKFEKIYRDTQLQSMVTRRRESLEIKDGIIYYLNRKLKIPSMVSFEKSYVINFSERGSNSSLQKIDIKFPLQNKQVSYQLYMGSGKYKKTVS
ncbi:competence type IV pilus minor pilin ComGD [Streptococcaceae bacterium ESL0729]|nr:competence type IV pilus minor pilin ComGD [Streptococcaceae bacterium ESL0729]